MSSAEYNALHIIHVLALLGLFGAVLYACVAPPVTRKRALIWSGIAGLIVATTGARMAQGIYGGMPVWVWGKLACWLGIAASVWTGYRWREKATVWVTASLALAAAALVMVYLRPF